MKDEFTYDREFFEEFGIDPSEIIQLLESYRTIKEMMDVKPARIRALMVLKQKNQANLLSSV